MEPNPGHSPTYQALLLAGRRPPQLRQVHAQIIVLGLRGSRPLLTKLLTSACLAGSIHYTRLLLLSVRSPDSFLFDSLIRAASKSGLFWDALFFYRGMRIARLPPSNFTFTSVIKACADVSNLEVGKWVHGHVLVSGFDSDSFVQASLVSLYAKSGELETARKVFDRVPVRSVIAWNAMMSGYEQNGLAKEGVQVFYKMWEEMVVPDSTTLVSLLSACSQLGHLSLGRWVHDYVVNNGLEINVILGTSLITMYSRCGDVQRARAVFDAMPQHNVVAWTAMISGYGMHGHGCEALSLFCQMREVGPPPNDVTFVSVLSACAHAGLVKEGLEAFASMKDDYGLNPRQEHHVCMVDMLGRAGFLDEALGFIRDGIPGEPGAAVWTALLGGCKLYKNFDLGVRVAELLFAVEPENPGHYVLLSNIFALAGRMDRVEMVRNKMIRKGLKKQIGYSMIEIDGVAHIFCMGDDSHPEAEKIHIYLEELIPKIIEFGYVPETELVMHELEEEERQVALRFHSEKLAIAYGLMKTLSRTTIRIVKNLRMCNDCHSAIKFISIVENREIVIRDKHRFHHFKEGSCSCGDFW